MDIKKLTGRVITASALALSIAAPLNANAVDTFAYPVDSKSQQVTVTVGKYALETFKVNLSATVALAYNSDETVAVIKTRSTKGMHNFGGSTSGGAVRQCEPTPLTVAAAKVALTAPALPPAVPAANALPPGCV